MLDIMIIRETRHEAAIRKAKEKAAADAESVKAAEAPVALRFKMMLLNYATSRRADGDASELLRPDAATRLQTIFPPSPGLTVVITEARACRVPTPQSPHFPFGCEAFGTVTGKKDDAMKWLYAAANTLAERNGEHLAEQTTKKDHE